MNGSINGRIRVVIPHNPPDVFDNCYRFPLLIPDTNCPFPGWTLEVLKFLCDALHYDMEIITYQNKVGSLNWGTLEKNGSWSGVLGLLANGSADLGSLLFQATDLREKYFELSYPVTNVQPVYVVRRQKEDIGDVLWNAFRPYSTVTWLCLLGSFLLQTLVMIVFSKVEVKMLKREIFRPYETEFLIAKQPTAKFQMAWHTLQLQLDEHSDDMRFFTIGGNILLFLFSLFQAGFFIPLYEGLLLSALLKNTDQNPFRDADGMIKLISEGKFHLTTNYMGNWYFDELANSNAAHFASLRSATQNNPVVISRAMTHRVTTSTSYQNSRIGSTSWTISNFSGGRVYFIRNRGNMVEAESVSAALDLVEKGNYIFPIQQDSLAMQLSKQRCHLVYVSEGLPQRSAHFVFANESQFLKKFNHEIVMQSMYIERTFRKYFLEDFKLGPLPKCDDSEFEGNSATKPLDLSSVFGIFMLGLFGTAAAIVAFIVEWYFFLHRRIITRRRRRAQRAIATAGNLVAIARHHLRSLGHNSPTVANNWNLAKLAEILERRRKSVKPDDDEDDIIDEC